MKFIVDAMSLKDNLTFQNQGEFMNFLTIYQKAGGQKLAVTISEVGGAKP